MKKMSILDSILESINQINWKSETHKSKAISLCKYIFSLYRDGDFNYYVRISSKTIEEIIKTKQYVKPIMDELINNDIIIKGNTYNVDRGLAKPFRFSDRIINEGKDFKCIICNIKENKDVKVNQKQMFDNLNNIIINQELLKVYHNCSPIENQTLIDYIFPILDRIKFDEKIHDYINNYTLRQEDIKINEEIEDDFLYVVFPNETYRYRKENALKLAKESDLELIQYRGRKCYIDDLDDFIKRKTKDMKILFKHKVFDIENNINYGSRNETNNRFDYNLTNMKGELIKYLQLDGEQLVELDIANAQFAILSYITDKLDDDFIELCQSGTLYEYLSERFNITRQEAKDKMFRVAFDKRKRDQDDIRNIFPLTMLFVDTYKGDNGYKFFSNLLQKTESLIMIDGLLNHLMLKGYEVLPIHDAMRVKESQANEIQKEINNYFESIKFKCNVRIKNK